MLSESLYGESCSDSVQCSHMLSGGRCQNGVCTCVNGLIYLRGRCRNLVDLGEFCDSDFDCNFGGERGSVTCLNNKCECAIGFYKRTENVCRRISLSEY